MRLTKEDINRIIKEVELQEMDEWERYICRLVDETYMEIEHSDWGDRD